MNFAIRKRAPDSRHNTCGYALEDGQVIVVEYNPKEAEKLKVVEAHGYETIETKAEAGEYSEAEFARLHAEKPAKGVPLEGAKFVDSDKKPLVDHDKKHR